MGTQQKEAQMITTTAAAPSFGSGSNRIAAETMTPPATAAKKIEVINHLFSLDKNKYWSFIYFIFLLNFC